MDGDCSHEIKRHLLLGRKAMTSLDSILKSRDITLQTKVQIVKAIFFSSMIQGYESWGGGPKMAEEHDGETTVSPTNSSKEYLNAE